MGASRTRSRGMAPTRSCTRPSRRPAVDRRHQRAVGSCQPADPHPVVRRGGPLPVQRRRRGRSGQPRQEADGHVLEPEDRPRLDADHPGRKPDRDGLRRKRPAPLLRALPRLRRVPDAGLGAGPPGPAYQRRPSARGRATSAATAMRPGATPSAGQRSARVPGGPRRRSTASPAFI